ncbi:hypothetical protein FF1_030833 [Malus domestica]
MGWRYRAGLFLIAAVFVIWVTSAEALPATTNPAAREAHLVLGLQASAFVGHVACVDWSLLDRLPGERSGSIPRRRPIFSSWGFVHHHRRFPRSAEELILTVATLFFLFALSHAHTSSDLPANKISGRDPASARLPESSLKPRHPTSIVPDYLSLWITVRIFEAVEYRVG